MGRELPSIDTEAEIRAALGLLDPVVRDAAYSLVQRILHHRELAADTVRLRMAFGEQCLFAMATHGWKLSDAGRFKAFLDSYAEWVMGLTLSILRLVTTQSRRRRWSLRRKQPGLLLDELFDRSGASGEAAG